MGISAHAAPAGPSLLLIEIGLTLIVVAVAFCWPRAGSGLFPKLENWFAQLARRRVLSVVVVGFAACLLRALILPLSPIPRPFIGDDFSFLLASDTFASGRLTNPTHPMWVHFEAFQLTHTPTYMSMYFPAQGMVMAAGKVLAGHPWWGIWASCGLMCAAICWMLQGWLPARWALLGGMLAVLRIALFSGWIDTYTGGAVAAMAGALVLGAVPRIRRAFRTRDFFWMALGMAILANSRPYEGLLVSVPAVIAVAWRLFRKAHLPVSILIRRLAPAVALLLITLTFMGYYNYRVFGSPLTPPYKVDRDTYASAPHFLWQSPKPEPVYRHKVLRDFYTGIELKEFIAARSLPGFLEASAKKIALALFFFVSFAMFAPLVMLPRVLRDRRIRFLLVTGGVLAAGLVIETWFSPHYMAPFTAGVYAIVLQCMRHLRFARPSAQPTGLFLVRTIPVLCLALAGLRLFAQPLHLRLDGDPWLSWYGGAKPMGAARAELITELESQPGQQLAIVRYSPDHIVTCYNDWVANAADIDGSKVVWARDMDPASNQELLAYFKDRKVWLVEPDFNPPKVSPYPTENAGHVGQRRYDLRSASLRGAKSAE
ncbi:MAG: hypothetical protein ACR2IV_08180 [Bryobacteraceae bacterium]